MVVHNYLERLIAKSSKERWDFSLIVIDLDNFKQINNAFGHLFGDLVLKKLAKIIKSSIRELDSVFRYGGDEFVVVLPGISKKIAREIAERLLKNIRNVEFEDGIRITASIGISSFPEDGETAQSLFESADRALYISKTLGKNTITAA
jgi:diguanylate cyclase (GGDEF)-like protein